MELSGIIKRILSFQQQRETAAARLNTLLNRPVQSAFDAAEELEQTSLTLTFDELQMIAEETRPVLIGLGHKIEQSRLAGKLAEKEYYPDMDFGVSYGQRDSGDAGDWPDFFSASVSFNIPLWYKTKESKKVSEEKANERRAVEQYNALKNSLYFRLKELTAEIEMSRQEIELFRTGLIPQSTLSFETAMSGYMVNKVDFLTIIDNQVRLYNYKIEYYRSVADHENTLAELEETIGRRLF